MFVEAIEKIEEFTRPLQIVSRNYGQGNLEPGAGTFFFVNELGDAVTCGHVAQLIFQSSAINHKYRQFVGEHFQIKNDAQYPYLLKELEKKYEYAIGTTIGLLLGFPNSVEPVSSINISIHPKYDLALIRFQEVERYLYKNHAVFLGDVSKAKRGKILCRYGYPFPEFSNFHHDTEIDDIRWNSSGKTQTPSFPIDGMITRMIDDGHNDIWGLEMSTPGLRGQSGGPLFDSDGVIYGMQSATNHIHLGFDVIDQPVKLGNGQYTKVSNHPFLHPGICVHTRIIKEFLVQHKVKFYEV
jgi:hypothetical protein